MHFLWYIAVFLITQLQKACNAEEECYTILQECYSGLSVLQPFSQTSLVPDNEYIRTACRVGIPTLQCIGNNEDQCRNQIEFDHVKALELAEEFCNESSSIRIAYVENIDCFNTLETIAKGCFTNATATVKSFLDYQIQKGTYYKNDDYETLKCLSFRMQTRCIDGYLEEKCGITAKLLFNFLVKKYEEIALNNKCDSQDMFGVTSELFKFSVRSLYEK